MTVGVRVARVAVAIAVVAVVGAVGAVQALDVARSTASGDAAALSLHATIANAATASRPAEALAKAALTISLSRWSTDAERAPLVSAFTAPPPTPPPPAPPPGTAA